MKKLIIWTLILGVIAYGPAKWYVHSEVSNAMDTGVLMVSPYAAVEYEGVSSTMTGTETSMPLHNVTRAPSIASLPKLTPAIAVCPKGPIITV